MSERFDSWASVYDHRAELYDDPLEICEFYSGQQHVDASWLEASGRMIAGLLDLQTKDALLEVGCGCGVIMNQMQSYGARLFGIDPAQKVIAKARSLNENPVFLAATAEALPFQNDSLDKAFAYQVFHYLHDLSAARDAILELKRVVRPGGRILLGQLPDASKEADYQHHRRQRHYNRKSVIEHNLRWIWYPRSFFTQFDREFSSVLIDDHAYEFDENYQWRMNVVLNV